MPYSDLREFLSVLETEGELKRVRGEVDPKFEVAKALRQIYDRDGPTLLFENVKGHKIPIVGCVFSNRKKVLLAFQSTQEKVLERFLHGLDDPIPPKIVSDGPVHEVVKVGDKVNLAELPICTFSPKDGGPYITAGIVISKDPETGIRNLGIYRHQVISKNTLALFAAPFHNLGVHISKAKERDRPLEAAIIIGTDPILAYASQVKLPPPGAEDLSVAGGIRGEAVELVKAKTIDLEVPAAAEIIIEEKIYPEKKIMEGPFGEFTGYYTPSSLKPVAEVTAITHRRNPIYQTLLTGKPVTENHILKSIPFEASFYRYIKPQFPGIRAVHMPPSGGCQNTIIISMKKEYEGQAKQAIMAAIAFQERPKIVIVVDEDINIFRPEEVEWALSFRMQPAEDVIIVTGVPAVHLDPSSDYSIPPEERTQSCMGIDATIPLGKKFPEVAEVPGAQTFRIPYE